MKSPKISIPNAKGFTLIEILVVVAIFSIIVGLNLLVSLDTYRAYLFHQDRDQALAALRQARSQALANTNQTPQTVLIKDQTVTFAPLSGRANPTEIDFSDGVRNIKIKINSEGRIDWENV